MSEYGSEKESKNMTTNAVYPSNWEIPLKTMVHHQRIIYTAINIFFSII